MSYDEKSFRWAREVVRAIAPTSMDHQGYKARGPKDAVKTETFGISLPDNEGLDIKNVLELVDRCNPEIHFRDIKVKYIAQVLGRLHKYEAKGSGGMLHVVAVPEPSLYSLDERDRAAFAGFRRVQLQKHNVKNKKAQSSGVPT